MARASDSKLYKIRYFVKIQEAGNIRPFFMSIHVLGLPPVAELTAYLILSGILTGVVEFSSFDTVRKKLRLDEIAIIAMGILVVLAIVELLHELGRSIAQVEGHRQVTCLAYLLRGCLDSSIGCVTLGEVAR
jgi:hypothetical protein